MFTDALTLTVLPGEYSLVRLPPSAGLPAWLPRPTGASSVAVLWSDREVSIMASTAALPELDAALGATRSDGWRCLRVEAVYDVDVPGIVASVVRPLADSGLSVMAVASFETDHLLVHEVERASAALRAAGHRVNDPDRRPGTSADSGSAGSR